MNLTYEDKLSFKMRLHLTRQIGAVQQVRRRRKRTVKPRGIVALVLRKPSSKVAKPKPNPPTLMKAKPIDADVAATR